MKAINIIWSTDGEQDVQLPNEMIIPKNIDEDMVTDYLSDETGWLVESYELIKDRYEVYDSNDEVVDSSDDLQDAQTSAEYENAKFILDTQTNRIVWPGSIHSSSAGSEDTEKPFALYKDAECIDEFELLADAEHEFEKTVKENPDSEIDILSSDGEVTFLSYDPSSREIYRDQHRL